MPKENFKRMTDFFATLGAEKVAHTKKSYLAHVIAVYRFMESEGCSDELCDAGMLHSVYGTQGFQDFTLPLERRPEVRALIGDRAERLAYLNCAMDRPTFDGIVRQEQGPYRFRDRFTGETVELSTEDYDDLCRIHLYDRLEQIPRVQGWDYRRQAFRQMAERLGPRAVAAYDRVYALEPSGQTSPQQTGTIPQSAAGMPRP
jgi:hypothetical protein